MKLIILILLIISYGISIERINLPIDEFTNWIVLNEDETWIGWIQFDKYPICKAERVLPHNINLISNAIEDKQNYPQIFDRITKIRIYEEDIIHIYLDMPFPISNRDYIVKYEFEKIATTMVYHFYAVTHPNSIQFSNSIRLPNAGGKWILEPINKNETKVTYIWNGELLGDFPNWALSRAWATQGQEVLDWLNSYLN